MSAAILETPIEYLKGVGPERADALKKELQIFTFGDLLSYYPFRYVDRTKFQKISELTTEMPFVQIVGKVTKIEELGQPRKKRLVALFADKTGTVELVWFRSISWIKPILKIGKEYVVFGKLNVFKGRVSIPHPELELQTEESTKISSALQPVYHTTEKLSAKWLNSKGIEKLQKVLSEKISGGISETLSQEIIGNYKFLSKQEAVHNIHFPVNAQLLQKAQFRLKFEELFFIQLEMLKMKVSRNEAVKGYVFESVGDYFNHFFQHVLPFELTAAQKRVIKEIRKDFGSGKQMNRLLQGDVGSGKTVVAFMLMLIAIDNDFQACLMAPTEILANQHFHTISKFADKLGIEVGLLTGSTKAAARNYLHEKLENGELKILIGTHALIEEKVQFQNLGFAVIDEQHRFGVAQRAKLWNKSPSPGPLPKGRGEKNAAKYETARVSSYHILKKLQVERKKHTTEAEQILWYHIKGKQLEQYKFRRQHVIDEFIVDFACLSKKLIVEIDGKYHGEQEVIEADKLRTQILESLGYKVIRFKNEEVIGSIDNVLEKIRKEAARPPTPFPREGKKEVLPLGEDLGGATVPHILVMTATPIPRTLAMTFYGDLDVSVIDELPPGRKPVKTIHRFESGRLRLFGFMKEQIAKGTQVYVVFPLIQESEKLDLKNLDEGYESICREFPRENYQVSIVHGKMKTQDKDFEMERFVQGKTHIMVSTTVIEVGVDVPNASLMVVESAERFGLPQLHQLRGRVGRGADQSYCILMSGYKMTDDAKTRMETMTRTTDGFEIAEVDLRLRGPGNLMGTQQSGILNLKIADLVKDGQILQLARQTAKKLLEEDSALSKPENKVIAKYFQQLRKGMPDWGRIS